MKKCTVHVHILVVTMKSYFNAFCASVDTRNFNTAILWFYIDSNSKCVQDYAHVNCIYSAKF